MTYIRSPEAGMFITGSMAIVGFYGLSKILYARWRLRNWWTNEKSRKFWKQIGSLTIWLGGSLIVLAIYIQDYYRQLPPDRPCISDYSDDGHLRTSWSLFARSCY